VGNHKFLFDEDVDTVLSVLAASRGHQVHLMADIKRGAPDPFVLETAEILGAVLVTKNKKHFEKLSPRDDSKQGRKYRHVGVIYMGGKEESHPGRFEDELDMVCLKLDRAKDAPDPRVIIEIRPNLTRIIP
jgi:hypothetical protein